MPIEEQIVELKIDHRERASGLIDELIDYAYETQSKRITTDVEVTQLEVGDIICSDRVGIERKSVHDFVDTVINPERNFAGQIADLRRAFKRPLMMLEGDSIYGLRNVHPEALRAHIAMVSVSFGVSIIPTHCIEETAAQIVTVARREQYRDKRKISIPHAKRTMMTMPMRQEYVVSSIGSGVGGETAERLLKQFGSVRAVMNASIDELMMVDKIGKKTAENIHDIIRSGYKK